MFNKEVQKENVIKLNLFTAPHKTELKLMCDVDADKTTTNGEQE